MSKIAKPRWLPTLLACAVSIVSVGWRPPVQSNGDAASPAAADTVFRHYL